MLSGKFVTGWPILFYGSGSKGRQYRRGHIIGYGERATGMAERIEKKNDPALSQSQALAGEQITTADAARALARWQRRTPDLLQRLEQIRRARRS